ncbi:MAG: hypothetical protein Satyrvirus37_7 [Satyrvirus sp.]|uniref:Uncharacterized protein n=1 Tax=Satyrvirus sp. TaxID=2487771 RepID=A0A3G5AF02_9VIRU|nr:MAG: hypothetical protein Satyrvirus37_7 [Satyrvirus sp.]
MVYLFQLDKNRKKIEKIISEFPHILILINIRGNDEISNI